MLPSSKDLADRESTAQFFSQNAKDCLTLWIVWASSGGVGVLLVMAGASEQVPAMVIVGLIMISGIGGSAAYLLGKGNERNATVREIRRRLEQRRNSQ